MPKTKEQIKPNYSPIYAALYPKLARIFIDNGYALAIHGSMARDFDVIAIPWVDKPSKPRKIVNIITSTFDIRLIGKRPTKKKHGRLVYTISIGHGACSLDLSFMPLTHL